MQRLLITGGSGFLGTNLAHRLQDEYNVFIGARNHSNLDKSSKLSSATPVPLDIASINSVRDTLRAIKPHVIIHAGATKYVDWSELHPLETIDINVLGSINILREAENFSVEKIIFISTDKAAPPIVNTYGLSKAIIERTFAIQAFNSDMNIVSLRYGNVLWSTGSFLHAWTRMAEVDGKIKSTGSNMTRFFFGVDNAVDFVIHSLNNISQLSGSILSIPMKTASIRDFLELFCKYKGVEYEIIPSRSGERNLEYLVSTEELSFSQELIINGKKLYKITPNIHSKNPLKNVISSNNSPTLNENEILAAIRSQPIDYTK